MFAEKNLYCHEWKIMDAYRPQQIRKIDCVNISFLDICCETVRPYIERDF